MLLYVGGMLSIRPSTNSSYWYSVSSTFFFQLAQPIRLLLNYVGEEFDDVHYEQGDG